MKALARMLWVVLSFVTVLSVGCGKSGPCSGGGMVVDDAPLAAALKNSGGLPPGAVACRAEEMAPVENRKLYELGANVDEGFEGSARHFVGNGWRQQSPVPDDVFRKVTFDKEGTVLTLACSKRVEGKGWCNVTLASAP